VSKPPTTWKGWERRVAKLFGGVRRGADYGGYSGGKNDVILSGYSIEVKLLSSPHWGDLVSAVAQAQAAKEHEDDIPLVVIKKLGSPDTSALVIMSVGDFVDNFVGAVDNDSNP
jgi:hypothetical protein